MISEPYDTTNRFALLVGVGQCPDDPRLSLRATINDARDLYQMLIKPEICGYNEANVSLLVNEIAEKRETSRDRIISGLQWLADRTHNKPVSSVILYFSGHAMRDPHHPGETEPCYLVTCNCHLNTISEKGISVKELFDTLKPIDAKNMLIILDCCHAGTFDGEKGDVGLLPGSLTRLPDSAQIYKQLDADQGRTIMFSSHKDQSSWLMEDKEHSIFTYYLLEALRKKICSTGQNTITAASIFDHISSKVPEMVRTIYGTETFQVPDLRGPRFVITYQSTREQPMSNTPDEVYFLADAKTLREILVDTDDYEQKDICNGLNFPHNTLDGGSPAERAVSLFDKLKKRNRLPDLEKELRRLFPNRFSPKAP